MINKLLLILNLLIIKDNIKKIHLIALVIQISFAFTSFGQEAKVKKTLEELRLQVTKSQKTVDDKILFKPGNEVYVMSFSGILLTDTLSDARLRGISVIARVAYKSTDTSYRRWTVNKLLTYFRDPNAGVTDMAAKYLTGFKINDFDAIAKDTIRKLLPGVKNHYNVLIKISGFAGLKDQAPILKKILLEGNLSAPQKWAAILALARLGEEEYIALCMLMVQKIPVNDNMVYQTLPDLIYTRQRAIFDYLVDLVNSNKTDCHSPNPNFSGKIMCAYRVMESLANVIDGFPVKTGPSGDLITDDYENALETTRNWLIENKDKYQINVNSY